MLRLHYWFTRIGRAEQIRLLLAELSLDWEEVDTPWRTPEWAALQWDPLWFGAQPALVDGAFSLVQSGVILSYLARKHHIAPQDLQGSATADALVWAAEDLRWEVFREPERFAAEGWAARWRPAFEHRLARSGSGFLVGAALTHADVAWWDALDQAAALIPGLGWPAGSPTDVFMASIAARPAIAAYLRSDRRPPGRSLRPG